MVRGIPGPPLYWREQIIGTFEWPDSTTGAPLLWAASTVGIHYRAWDTGEWLRWFQPDFGHTITSVALDEHHRLYVDLDTPHGPMVLRCAAFDRILEEV